MEIILYFILAIVSFASIVYGWLNSNNTFKCFKFITIGTIGLIIFAHNLKIINTNKSPHNKIIFK